MNQNGRIQINLGRLLNESGLSRNKFCQKAEIQRSRQRSCSVFFPIMFRLCVTHEIHSVIPCLLSLFNQVSSYHEYLLIVSIQSASSSIPMVVNLLLYASCQLHFIFLFYKSIIFIQWPPHICCLQSNL